MEEKLRIRINQMLEGKTSFFLGAGFSKEAGMPLVGELTAELKNALLPDKLREFNKNWKASGSEFGIPDEIIEDFIEKLHDPNIHYEKVIGYIQ